MNSVPRKVGRCTRSVSRFAFSLMTLLAICAASATSATSSGPPVGSIAPDFKARNIVSRQSIPLSGQRGKVVIVTFWASWCAPCRRELPILEGAQEMLGKDKLTVFAVSYRDSDSEQRLRKIASSWQINLVEDSNGWIASHYGISSIPHLFIIGRDGTVLANHIGYGDRSLEELVDDINKALAGDSPADPPQQTASGST
jgi:thiol-disulfide isomerase/thioredoxin